MSSGLPFTRSYLLETSCRMTLWLAQPESLARRWFLWAASRWSSGAERLAAAHPIGKRIDGSPPGVAASVNFGDFTVSAMLCEDILQWGCLDGGIGRPLCRTVHCPQSAVRYR